MRDSAVRCEFGVSLRNAARLLGVSDNTLRIYEIDPSAVKDERKRAVIASFCSGMRTFLEGIASTRSAA